MGRGRSLYQEYSWWGKCWLLTCLGETDKGRVCERWPGRPPGLTPGGVFPGVGTGGRVDEGRGPGAQYISLTLFQHNKCSTFLRSNRPLPETIMMSLSGVSERYWAQGPLPSSTLPPVPTREQHLPVEGSKGVEIVCNSRPFCAVFFLNG